MGNDTGNVWFFVQMWAEAVLRQLDRVREMREKDRTDLRNWDRGQEGSPTDDDVARNFRILWTEEQILVWAAYQLERWTRRLAIERGREPTTPDPVLMDVRNALEQLDEVDVAADAPPGSLGGSRSLRELPGGNIAIAVGGRKAFDLIDPEELGARVLAVVEQYLELMSPSAG